MSNDTHIISSCGWEVKRWKTEQPYFLRVRVFLLWRSFEKWQTCLSFHSFLLCVFFAHLNPLHTKSFRVLSCWIFVFMKGWGFFNEKISFQCCRVCRWGCLDLILSTLFIDNHFKKIPNNVSYILITICLSKQNIVSLYKIRENIGFEDLPY